jgi:hypothetical protein
MGIDLNTYVGFYFTLSKLPTFEKKVKVRRCSNESHGVCYDNKIKYCSTCGEAIEYFETIEKVFDSELFLGSEFYFTEFHDEIYFMPDWSGCCTHNCKHINNKQDQVAIDLNDDYKNKAKDIFIKKLAKLQEKLSLDIEISVKFGVICYMS